MSSGETAFDEKGFRFFLSRILTALVSLLIIALVKVFGPELVSFTLVLALVTTYIVVLSLLYVAGIRKNFIVLLMLDSFFATVLIYLTGSHDSQFQFLYLILIVYGGFYLKRDQLHLLAATSVVFFSTLLLLQFFGHIPAFSRTTLTETVLSYVIGVNFVALLMVSLVIGILSGRIGKLTGQVEQKERRLREITLLKNQIVDAIPSGLITTDAQLNITFLNNEARNFVSRNAFLSNGELIGTDVNRLIPVADILDEEESDVVQRKEHTFENGIIVGMNISRMYSDRKFTGLLIVFQDLTEWKALEKSIWFKNSLMSLGEMAAGIAHEIRNPLASITGAVQLLQERSTSGEENELFDIIRGELVRLGSTIQDFLSFTKESQAELAAENVHQLVGETISLFEKGRTQDIVLEVEEKVYSGCAMVKCERGKLKRVLWNILKNAEKAIQYQSVKRIEVTIEDQEQEVAILISDSGRGVPVELRKQIFEPYFSTFAKGFGLGLSISKTILEEIGGTIEVDENRDGGAVFSIHMPRCDITEASGVSND